MGKRIDEFCEDLRLKLTNIENGLNSLKAKAEGKAEQAEKEVRSHLAAVQKRLAQDEAKASAARGEIKAWLDQKKTATAEKITEWKAKAETAHLNHRADMAERYAQATVAVAMAALDEAEQATLEAWLARADATLGRSK